MKRSQSDKRSNYINEFFVEECEDLMRAKKSIEENNLPKINIGADEGKILYFLIKATGAKNIIEIGTLAGYSTLWMAKALPEGGHITTIEACDKEFEVSKTNFKASQYNDKITLLKGDAHKVLSNLKNDKSFDMIFIDAEKKGYPKYLDWAEDNLQKGGLIVGDNTFLFGAVYDEENEYGVKNPKMVEAMNEFNSRVGNTDKFDSIIIPTVEGLTVAIKTF